MAQPIRKRLGKAVKIFPKDNEYHGKGDGLDYCNECPFLNLGTIPASCNPNSRNLEYTDRDKIPVPQWCGNNKDYIKEHENK